MKPFTPPANQSRREGMRVKLAKLIRDARLSDEELALLPQVAVEFMSKRLGPDHVSMDTENVQSRAEAELADFEHDWLIDMQNRPVRYEVARDRRFSVGSVYL